MSFGSQMMMGAGSATATPFSPDQLANLDAWWDFDDSGTITIVTGEISALNDKSGNANHMDDGNAGSRPAEPTGSPATSLFTTDNMDATSITTNVWTNKAATLVFVSDKNNAGGYFAMVDSSLATQDHQGITIYSPGTGAGVTLNYGDGATYTGVGDLLQQDYNSAAGNGSTLRVTAVRISTSAVSVREDGVAMTLTPSFSMPQANFAATSPASARARIGGRLHTTNTSCNHKFGEVILYSSYLSDSDLEQVESYLATKWGL